MDTLQAKYDKLSIKPTFQNLKKNIPIIATWDDHDFGIRMNKTREVAEKAH